MKPHRQSLWACLLCLLMVGLLATGLPRLQVDNSFEIWFPEDDAALLSYRQFLMEFGSDEVVVLGIQLPDATALAPERTSRLRKLTETLAQQPGISRVLSLPSDAELEAGLFGDQDQIKDFYVSPHRNAYKLLVWMAPLPDLESRRHKILEAIDQSAAAAFPDRRDIWLAGTGVVLDALNRETLSQGGIFLPLSYGLILLVLAAITRSWGWTGLAAAILILANCGLFGLMGWLDRPVTMITVALPPLILVVTVSTLLHFARTPGSFGNIARPVVFSGLTSACGFFSLGAAEMLITRDYGLFAGIGVLLALALSLTGAGLLFQQTDHRRTSKPQTGMTRLNQSVRFLLQYQRSVLVVGGLVVLGALVLARSLIIDTYPLGFLPDNHRARQDNQQLEAQFGPYLPMEFILQYPNFSGAMTFEDMSILRQLQRAVEELPFVGSSLSVLDVNQNYSSGTAPSRWVDDSGQRLRVSWTTPIGSARDIGVMERQILDTAAEQLPEGAVLSSSGYLPLYNRLVEHLLSDQLNSLAIAALSVFGIMGLLLRRLRVLIYAFAVNLLPLCSLLALMSLASVPLDIATITVAPAMLGLIVDDSIHWLYHYHRCRADGLAVVPALEQTNRTIGHTLVSTSVVLVLGFGILGFAGIDSIATNGLLMAWTVVVALLTDLLLLPV